MSCLQISINEFIVKGQNFEVVGVILWDLDEITFHLFIDCCLEISSISDI
jgi:hypothetical protein